MKRIAASKIAASLVLLIAGCGTSTTSEVVGPSGIAVTTVKCSRSPNQCMANASAACGGGSYQVLNSESHAGGLLADVMPGPVAWYSMTFQCGPSDGDMPEFPLGGPEFVPPPVIVQQPAQRTMTTTNCNVHDNMVSCSSF